MAICVSTRPRHDQWYSITCKVPVQCEAPRRNLHERPWSLRMSNPVCHESGLKVFRTQDLAFHTRFAWIHPPSKLSRYVVDELAAAQERGEDGHSRGLDEVRMHHLEIGIISCGPTCGIPTSIMFNPIVL